MAGNIEMVKETHHWVALLYLILRGFLFPKVTFFFFKLIYLQDEQEAA